MKKKKKSPGNQPSQPDHNPGHKPNAGDGSDQTRQPRKRPSSTAHDAGSSMPSLDAEATDGSSEEASSSDAVAAAITSIVKSACQVRQLTEEQQGVLRKCLSVLLNHDSSRLCKGRALLTIIEHRLMPSWPDVVENSYPLFQLSQTDVRELVKLAREDPAQNGRIPSFAGGDARVSARSTNKELPASSAPSANLNDSGPDVAQSAAPEEKQAPVIAETKVAAVAVSPVDEQAQAPAPAPEKKRALTKKPKAAEVAAPQGGEPVQNLAPPPVEKAMSDPAEPARTPAGPIEQATQADTVPPVAKPEADGAACVGQAPVQAMAEDDEVPAPGKATRLTVSTHRVEGSPAPSNAAGVEGANETASPSHEHLTTPLADARKDKLERCVATLTSPDSSRLDRGYALLLIIENRLIHVLKNGMLLDAKRKFGLTPLEVGKLVALAREHRDQNGGRASTPDGRAHLSGSSSSEQPPASPPKAATGGEKSAHSAPNPAPEKKRPVKMKEEATEANAPQTGEPVQSLANPSVETTQPGPAELTREGEIPSGIGQRKKLQTVAKQAADKANVGTTLTLSEQEQRLLQLETIVERGFTSVWEIGKAMLEIRDTKLYMKRYKTFEAYCAERWAKHRSRCYQLMAAAEVQANLSTQVDIADLTEKDCRELFKLKKPADQCIAWKEAAAAAPDGKVTLPSLKEVVAKLRPPSRTMAARKTKAMIEVDAEAVGSEDVLPDRPLDKAVPIQPEAPPADSSAHFVSEDFDLHSEWRTVEDSLRNLFSRCPAHQRDQLWALLNSFEEYAPETAHRPKHSRRVLLRPPSNVGS